MKYLALGLFVILLVVFGPLGFIWAINTLFDLGIEYTLKTWAASAIVGILLSSSRPSR